VYLIREIKMPVLVFMDWWVIERGREKGKCSRIFQEEGGEKKKQRGKR